LCTKIQEENDNLVKEKAELQMTLIEAKQQLNEFIRDSNSVYEKHGKLCSMIIQILQANKH